MRALALLVLTLTFISSAWAQKIHVVTRNLEPFSFEKDGRRTGFAMELWDAVARETKMDYDVTVTDTAKNIVAAVEAKQAEVGVGAISITSEREKIIDFSQPFYQSGLQILVSKGQTDFKATVFSLLGSVLNWKSLGSLALLIIVMLVISHLVWLYEHKVNEEMWPKHYLSGMWESFWWSISILLVGGADNKGPVGLGGRIVAIVWMLLSIVLVSLLTATFTTTLTLNSLKGDIDGPEDLPGKQVATIKDSTAEAWLKKHDVKVSTYGDIKECIDALKDGTVKAVVFDEPIIKYALKKSGDDTLALAGPRFDANDYGFALQQDSTIREKIDQALLSLSESGVTDELREKWFGKEN